jgi:hypothetical protein
MTRQILLSCLLGAALFAGCTDDVDVADNDTATGSGAGGTGASGGSTASGPSTGGATSSGAANGGAGAGGGGTSLPECEQARDCQLINDCCACEGLPADVQVEECLANCEQPSCEALGHTATAPMCVHGTCVAGFDCSSLVNCFMAKPECPPGEVPMHRDGCWGACVPATECAAVTDCTECDLETQVCVQYVSFSVSVHCLPKPETCSGAADCACAGAAYCDPVSDQCSGGNGILSCDCLDC